MTQRKKYAPVLIPLGILGAALLFTGAVWLLQYLWNSTLPELLGVKTITFWQMFRLFLLTSILLKGSHTVAEGGGRSRRKFVSQYVFSAKEGE